jgi:hypothetical protein
MQLLWGISYDTSCHSSYIAQTIASTIITLQQSASKYEWDEANKKTQNSNKKTQ